MKKFKDGLPRKGLSSRPKKLKKSTKTFESTTGKFYKSLKTPEPVLNQNEPSFWKWVIRVFNLLERVDPLDLSLWSLWTTNQVNYLERVLVLIQNQVEKSGSFLRWVCCLLSLQPVYQLIDQARTVPSFFVPLALGIAWLALFGIWQRFFIPYFKKGQNRFFLLTGIQYILGGIFCISVFFLEVKIWSFIELNFIYSLNSLSLFILWHWILFLLIAPLRFLFAFPYNFNKSDLFKKI